MKIIITGATGFVGKALCQKLKDNYEVIALTRNTEKAKSILGSKIKTVFWDSQNIGQWKNELEDAFCVINLAGENVSGRWTKQKKLAIIHSRLASTSAIAEAIKQAKNKPKILIQASAMAFYGSRGSIEADEKSPNGDGFLAHLCYDWERAIEPVTNLGVRCAILRIGLVLGKNEGVLPKLILPFKFYAGGYIGSGEQYLSWISIQDLVSAVEFLIKNDNCCGPYNLSAPEPVKLKEFCRILGKIIKRPCWTIIPAFISRLFFGEMAEELLLASYKIRPKKLLQAGFNFEFSGTEEALTDILKSETK